MRCPVCGRERGRNKRHKRFSTARQIIQHIRHVHPDYVVEGTHLDVWVRSPDGHTAPLVEAHKEYLIVGWDYKLVPEKPEFPVYYDTQGQEHEVF